MLKKQKNEKHSLKYIKDQYVHGERIQKALKGNKEELDKYFSS